VENRKWPDAGTFWIDRQQIILKTLKGIGVKMSVADTLMSVEIVVIV
jgi:hypothetical protein